ncbi:epstein-Barr nuclear antigen 1 [Microsporum canis CBS 113480]|uniref:Epstein-Barr nuclear antigen 1 n=1 Tax=Arthroderma otae (strain ATCC MYA-4605 / CBS 113480) TaxID=554155 RepID=C5FH38_ARTOC|nr:epstein-Barr nuclear antigen 1 [Microsporum canis CBS 113480]EEQ28668.1 epstein-Barr nuclear antigen 1 [Microsporum canis CBS 113480]
MDFTMALAEIEAEARALALVHEHTRALAAAESEAEARAQAAVLRQLQAYAETGADAQAQQAEAARMGTHDRARARMQWKEEQDQATVEAQARLAEQEANPNRQDLSPRQLRRRRPPNYFYPVSRGISEAASLYEARAEALGEVVEDSLLAADRGSDGEEGGEVFIRHGLVHDGDMTDPPRLTQLNLSVNMLMLGQITEDEWALARREENQRARAREVVLGNVLRGVRRRFDGWRRLVEWLRGVGEALEGFEMEYDEGVEGEEKGDLAGVEGEEKGDLAGVEEEEKGDLAGFEDDIETDE